MLEIAAKAPIKCCGAFWLPSVRIILGIRSIWDKVAREERERSSVLFQGLVRVQTELCVSSVVDSFETILG
jgi:hypothetical protein